MRETQCAFILKKKSLLDEAIQTYYVSAFQLKCNKHMYKKVKEDNDQEMAQSEKKSYSKNRGGTKHSNFNNQILILRKHIVS